MAVLAVALPHVAMGQTWQVDLNGTSARYDTGARTTSAGLSPQLEWTGARSLVVLGGTVAAMDGSSLSTQGRGEGWLFIPAGRQSSLGAALSTGASGSVHSSGYRTAGTGAELRWMMGRAKTGGWVGFGGTTGWTSFSNSGIAGAWGPTAGLWTRNKTRRGEWTGSVALRPFRFRQSWFTEIGGSLILREGHADLTAFAGWRHAPAGTLVTSQAWGGAALALQVARQFALTVSAGTYPSDFLQALPHARYLSLGLRVANRFTRAQREPPPVYLPRRLGGAGGRELRFSVAGATTVAIVGDWTGWAPVPLEHRSGNTWTLQVTLPSGVYRFSLITDGERWIVPAEVTAVDDGLGGKTGLLVIP